jgi:hypothetical protein
MNFELFEQVAEYLNLPDLLVLSLQNEDCYELIHNSVWRRDYLKQRTEFIPEQVAPWIGYFDDFPDDDLEYAIYDFARQFIRESCYYLSKEDLEQLFKDNEPLFLFAIEYGDIPGQVIGALKLFDTEGMEEQFADIVPNLLGGNTIEIMNIIGTIAGSSLSRHMTVQKIQGNPVHYRKIADTIRSHVYHGIPSDSVGLINQALKRLPPVEFEANIYPEVNPQWTHVFRIGDVLGFDLGKEYDETFDWERNQLGNLLVSKVFTSLLKAPDTIIHIFATTENISRFENFLISRKIRIHGQTIQSILSSRDDHILEYFKEYPYLTDEAREVLGEIELAHNI